MGVPDNYYLGQKTKTVWTWNGADVTQFDTKVDGGDVASSVISVATEGGVAWVKLVVTGDGSVANWGAATTLLPILCTPSSVNYGIECDYMCLDGGASNYAGAVCGVRWDGTNLYGVYNGTQAAELVYPTTFPSATATPRYASFANADGKGQTFVIQTEGDGAGANHIKHGPNGTLFSQIVTGGISAVGAAAIGVTAGATSNVVEGLYRNIRIFEVV